MGGGGGLQGLRGPIDAGVRPRWREDERQPGPRRPEPRWGGQDHDGMRWADNNLPLRPPTDLAALGGTPMDRWGGEAGRGRGRGPPGPGPAPSRWGPPGPDRHQHPDRWGGPVAAEAGRRDKWDKWTAAEGGTKEPNAPHDDKWRPPHAGFGPGPSMRDAPGFGHTPGFGSPGGHAFPEHRGDPTPAGTGRGFAIGRGRAPQGPARAPGADGSRWGAGHPHLPGIGQEPAADGTTTSIADPPQSFGSVANAKYQRPEMEAVYFELHAKHALRLPMGVNQDDPSLFAVSGQPTVLEILHSVDHGRAPAEDKPAMPDTPAAGADTKGPAPSTPAAGQSDQQPTADTPSPAAATYDPASDRDRQQSQAHQPPASPFAATPADATAGVSSAVSAPHEHLQDTWVYRDPNWEVQGPFSKADILDWFEGGYFPADLPIKHASSPQADFKPLAAQIKIWAAAAPPGFARQEPQNGGPAPSPATPAQQVPLDQQPLSTAASGMQAQQQPQSDMAKAFTLTSADSGMVQHMGPATASSARLDALETGSNQFPAAQPAPAHPAPAASGTAGMDFLKELLTRGNSGVVQPRPTPGQGQDPLGQFPGLQQGASAAAPWGHQPGPAASGQFDNGSPLLGLVGSGLGQDPFAQRQYNQPAQHQPPQQHALPAFLQGANHMQDRSISLRQGEGMFGQAHAPHASAHLDHMSLASHSLNLAPQQQQQQQWGGQQQLAGNDHSFEFRRPEQHQPEQPSPETEFHRMFQRAGMPQQQQQQSHQQPPLQHVPHSPVISQADQAVPKPQPSTKGLESAVEAFPARHTAPAVSQPPQQLQQEQEALTAPKRRPAPPKKAAPGPPSPQPAAPAHTNTPAWAMPEQQPPSLAGVQLEQRLQQQQQQQEVRDWGLPPEAPASPKKVEPKAPWGAAKPAGPVRGNLQDVIKEEEAAAAAAAAARAAQPAVADVKTAAPGATRTGGWARVAAGPTSTKAPTMKEIQDEEERARRSENRQQQQIQQQQQQPDHTSGAFLLRDSLVGDAQALVAPKMAPWAGAAGRYQEESAADLEGGDFPPRQDHFAQPPPPPPRKPAAKDDKKKTLQEVKREQMEEQRRAAAAARQELKEDRKPKQTAAGPAPSMALRTQASLQRALSNDDDGMFWDYGQAAGLRAGNGALPPAAQPKQAAQPNGRPVAGQQWQPPQSPPAPSAKPVLQDLPATESVKMSSELRTWASQQIRSLSKGRIDDPSVLLDVLMDTPSNGEVVEGCLVNIERNGNVSAFATEFIRRKAAELVGSNRNKPKAKANANALPAGVAPGSGMIAGSGLPPAAAASDAAKFQKVPKANKGKKGKAGKGQKVDNKMLGFQDTRDFNVLQSGDD
ncbi:kinesin-like protein [Trebouxia sp. C0009 RCD-2024]